MDKTSNFIQFLSYYLLFVKLKVIVCGEAETLKIKLGLKHISLFLFLSLSLSLSLETYAAEPMSQGNKY